jgi:hypothetical protein
MVSEQLVREFWLRFKGLPARFQTATTSFPEQLDKRRTSSFSSGANLS